MISSFRSFLTVRIRTSVVFISRVCLPVFVLLCFVPGSLSAQDTEKGNTNIRLTPAEAEISGKHKTLVKDGINYVQLVGKAKLVYQFQVERDGYYDFFVRYGDFGKNNHRSRIQCFLNGEPAGTTFVPVDHPPKSKEDGERNHVSKERLHVQKRHLNAGKHTLELRSLTWYGGKQPSEWFGPITIQPSERSGPDFSKQDYRHVDHDPRYGPEDRYDPDAFKLELDFYDAENLLQNGNFENGTGGTLPNWKKTGQVERTGEVARRGDNAIKISSEGDPSFVLSDPIPIDRDQRYEIEAWYRIEDLKTGHADVMLIWLDGDGNVIGSRRAGSRLHLGFPDHRTFYKTGWFNIFYVTGPEIITGYSQAWEKGEPGIPEGAEQVRVKVRVKNGTVHFDGLSFRPYTRATFKGGGSLAIPRPIRSNELPGSSTFQVRLQEGSDVVKQVDQWSARVEGKKAEVQSASFNSSDNHWNVQLRVPELSPGRHFVDWHIRSGETVFKPKGQLWVYRPPQDELVIASLTDTHYDDPLMVEFPWHEAMGRIMVEQMNLIQPDVMSYLGDYSAGPHTKPYFAWRDVKLANFPVFFGTGNHENDRRNEWIFSKFFGRWKEERETGWYEAVNVGDFSFIMIDGNYLWSGDHSLTDMNEEQLDWFQETMESSTAGLNVVMDEASIRMRNWRNKNVGSSYHSDKSKEALQRLRDITESHRSLVLQGDRHQGSTLTKGKGSYLQVPAPARSFGLYKYAGFGLARVRSDGTLRFWDVVGMYGENSTRVYHYGWSPEKDVFPWDIPVFEIQQPDSESLVFQVGDTLGYEQFPVVRSNHGLWGPGQYTIHAGGRVIMGLDLPRLSGTHSFRRQGRLIPSEGVLDVNVTDWTSEHRRMNVTGVPGQNHIRVRLTDLPGNTTCTIRAGDRQMERRTDEKGVLTFETEQDFSEPTLIDVRLN